MTAFVKQEVKNNIGYITFFHPAGNSFPSAQLNELVKTACEMLWMRKVKSRDVELGRVKT